jgi:hypothetical protein
MDYEQKYKDALERAREFQKSKDELCVLTAESIFPELKESEDERIRKSLINVFSNRKKYLIDQSFGDSKVKDIIAWLEKQGEKKSKWSDEDANTLKAIIYTVKNSGYNYCIGVSNEEMVALLEKQGEQKHIWSKEDEIGFSDTLWAIQQARTIAKDENDMGNLWYAEDWLKSLKERLS